MRLILILFALAILSQPAPGAISTTPEITTYLCCDSCFAPSQSDCVMECPSCYKAEIDLCSSSFCFLSSTDKEWEKVSDNVFESQIYRRKAACEKKTIDGKCTSVYTYECGCAKYDSFMIDGGMAHKVSTYYYPSECDTATGDASCKACPDGGKTDAYGTKISDCYLPTGTEMSDESGTYEFTSNCHYSSN